MKKIPVLDPAKLDALRSTQKAGRKDAAAEMIEIFLRNCAKHRAAVAAAIARHDNTTVMREAKSLKMSAMNVGAAKLQDVCWNLEKVAFSGDMAAIRTLHVTFEATCDELILFLGTNQKSA